MTMIKKIGNKYCLFTKDGKRKIVCHSTRAECEAAERMLSRMKQKKTMSHEGDPSNKLELTTVPMAVLPLAPSKTMLPDVEIDKDMIDGFLSYNPAFRSAYLYLNEESAHNKKGKTNQAVIGKFVKTYAKDGLAYGDVELQKLYRDETKQKEWEKDIILAISEEGGFPERSVDMYANIPNWNKKWLFDGCAVVGAARGATINLPSIKYKEILEQNGLSALSIKLSTKTENSDMTKEEILEMMKKREEELESKNQEVLKLALEKQKEEIENSFSAREKKIRDEMNASNASARRREAEVFFSSPVIQKKILSTERDNWKEIYLAAQELNDVKVNRTKKVELSVNGKTETKDEVEQIQLSVAIKNAIESLPDYVSTKRITSGKEVAEGKDNIKEEGDMLLNPETLELTLKGESSDEQRFNLIRSAAAELKLSLADKKTYVENYTKAEAHAIALTLQSKNAKHLFSKESETTLSKQ